MDLQVMPKQVSALNTFWLIEYLRQNHPEVDLKNVLENIQLEESYYVENLKTGKIEKLTLDHLLDTQYWFSNRFMIDLYNEIQSRIPDPELAYKMGRTSYKTQPILKTAIAVPILGPKGVLKRAVKENSKYNRTKETIIIKNEKGHIILRLIHNVGIKINRFAMEWHRGVYEAYATLAGATDVRIDLSCVDQEKAIYDFDIRFKEPTLFSRLLRIVLFNIPIVKEIVEKAEEIQMEHKEQILHRDKIIDDRTKQLRETQAKLIEAEKRSLEHRITGGFAHEMRNALSGALYELKELENSSSDNTISEKAHQDLAKITKAFVRLEEDYEIPKEYISKQIFPHLKSLLDSQREIEATLRNVHSDIERGLGITNQIREYARMQEQTRGDDLVNALELAKRYGEIYRERIERLGINYQVKSEGESTIKGDNAQINSILENLVKNALEAVEKAPQKDVLVNISKIEKDGIPYLKVVVIDTGEGIAQENLQNIFYPFYSTKPGTGTGLGLSVVKRMVELYGSILNVESELGKGTEFVLELMMS